MQTHSTKPASFDVGREDLRKKVEAKLALWDAKLGELEARAKTASAEAKVQLLQQRDELRKLQDSAKAHYQRIATQSSDAWNDVKQSLEDGWTKLSSSIETAWKRAKH